MNPVTPSSLHSLPGPDDITRVELPNGITVLTRPNFNSPSVVVGGYMMIGSLFDPDEKLGLAQFTALSLTRGTQRRNFQQIFDALESIGAGLSFSSGVHSTSFNGRSLIEDLPVLLGLLREALLEPAFPAEQIERLRHQLLTGLAIRTQDTGDMASIAFDEIVFKGHPYARPEDGFPETVQSITRQDIVDFHRRLYGPRGMVVAVIGAIEPQAAVAQIERVLGDWKNPEQPLPPQLPTVQPMDGSVDKEVIILGKSQSDIVMGCVGPSRLSSDFMSASLGNNILGQFGMMGRIGDVVREQSGLAYYAYTSLNAGLGPGSWQVTAGVNPVNVHKTIDLARQEVRRFVSSPVSAGELSDSQENYIGRLPLSLESNQGMAGALLNLERFNLGLDYYRRYPDLVRKVTPDSILEVAHRYLDPDRMAIAWAGPQIQTEGSAEAEG